MSERRRISDHDRRELDAFVRFLEIAAWRHMELGETQLVANRQAAIAVYGDQFAEGEAHE